jgi:hypothetical protein
METPIGMGSVRLEIRDSYEISPARSEKCSSAQRVAKDLVSPTDDRDLWPSCNRGDTERREAVQQGGFSDWMLIAEQVCSEVRALTQGDRPGNLVSRIRWGVQGS